MAVPNVMLLGLKARSIISTYTVASGLVDIIHAMRGRSQIACCDGNRVMYLSLVGHWVLILSSARFVKTSTASHPKHSSTSTYGRLSPTSKYRFDIGARLRWRCEDFRIRQMAHLHDWRCASRHSRALPAGNGSVERPSPERARIRMGKRRVPQTSQPKPSGPSITLTAACFGAPSANGRTIIPRIYT